MLVTTCWAGSSGYGQASKLHPYIGGSLNFWGVSAPGWGIDGGVKIGTWYAGAEYGRYGHEITTVSLPAGETYHPIYEDYYGAHGGAVINDLIYLGVTFLSSKDYYVDGRSNTWFNLGPDVRVQAWNRVLFALAYTVRRGLDAGINILF